MIQSSPRRDNSWWYTACETPTEFENHGYEAAVWGSDGDMVCAVYDNLSQDESAELRAKRISLLPDLLDALKEHFGCSECTDGMTSTQDRCKTCDGTGFYCKDSWTLRDILSEMNEV